MSKIFILILLATAILGCSTNVKKEANKNEKMAANPEIKKKAEEFVSFKLTTDLSILSENEKQMLPILLEAAKLWTIFIGNKRMEIKKN